MNKILIIGLIVACLLLVIPLFFLPKKGASLPPQKIVPKSSSLPSALPASKISSYLKTTIGETKEQAIASLGTPLSSKLLPNGLVQYSFASPVLVRAHLVVTKNNLVVYERASTVDSQRQHPLISEFEQKKGLAEKIFKGHSFFGEFETTYVYASKGFALVANPFTQEIDEIQYFTPTTIEEYTKDWGQDIKEEPGQPERFAP